MKLSSFFAASLSDSPNVSVLDFRLLDMMPQLFGELHGTYSVDPTLRNHCSEGVIGLRLNLREQDRNIKESDDSLSKTQDVGILFGILLKTINSL